MPASFYGCTASDHQEFTCLAALYVGPKKYKKKEKWCDYCRSTYRHPDDEYDEDKARLEQIAQEGTAS